MSMIKIDGMAGGEIEATEPTGLLRWAPNGRFGIGAETKKLQQGWRIYTQDGGGRMIGSRIEWRDVPDAA